MAEEEAAAGGVSVFPGWEFFTSVAGAEDQSAEAAAQVPCCLSMSLQWCSNQIDRWWNKVEQRHERSASAR